VCLYVSAVLIGRDIEAVHCVLHHESGNVTLLPVAGAMCCINNVQIMDPTKLSQGCLSYVCSVEILPLGYSICLYFIVYIWKKSLGHYYS